MSNRTQSLAALTRAAQRMTSAAKNRDQLIVAAREDGATWREIRTAAGLTEPAVLSAARRANGGELPRPRA